MNVQHILPHDSAELHVSGSARYIDDIPVPANMLHLAFGISSVAAGKITNINLDAVRKANDVIAVLTANDLKHDADTSPSNHDEPLLAIDNVHYAGQPIFLVIAKTHLAARKAARRGSIKITEHAPILTIEQALTANSRFEDTPRIYEKGNCCEALLSSTHRLQGSLQIGGQEHFYLEGQVAMAWPQENGDMHVFSSTQHPTEIQHKVADALGIPMVNVRVETRRMGGGFGGKESQGNSVAVACAIAAQITGRPCKLRYDRDDDMLITGKRHDFLIKYDVGFDKNGRINAVSFVHYIRCGW